MLRKEALELPLDDFLNVKSLERVDDLIYHPDPLLRDRMEYFKLQAYIVSGTIYGCLVNKTGAKDGSLDEEKLDFQWFGYHLTKEPPNHIMPDASYDFQDILDRCDADSIEGLLYHLDIFSKSQ